MSEGLEKDRKILRLLIENLRWPAEIHISGRKYFNIENYTPRRTFMINMLEEAVEHLRNKNISIVWKIDTNMANCQNKEWTYYEDPYWKLIANGDKLVMYFIDGMNYEHFLQLINKVQLAEIYFDLFPHLVNEKDLEILILIKKVTRARIIYGAEDLIFEVTDEN